MPLDIRALKYSTLCNDSPITPFGRFTCALIGRALRNRHIIPDRIVCAPALRAVQSASVIAEMLHMSVTVRFWKSAFENIISSEISVKTTLLIVLNFTYARGFPTLKLSRKFCTLPFLRNFTSASLISCGLHDNYYSN